LSAGALAGRRLGLRGLLLALALAACSSSGDARSLVAIDVTLAAGLNVDRVDLTVMPVAGASVAQSFSWTDASGGVLRAGIYLPAGIAGSAVLRSRGYAGATEVAQAADVPLAIVPGERTGPIAITLARVALPADAAMPFPDAGADAANPGADAADAGAGDDATDPGDADQDVAVDLAAEPDGGSDVGLDRAADLAPDLAPDVPSEPPSLVTCTAYAHITGTCDTTTGAGDWAVPAVRFSPDGKFVVTAGQDGRCKIWKVTAAGLVPDGRVYSGSGTMRADFSPDGVYLAITSRDGPLTLIDFARNAMLGDFVGHPGQVNAIAFAPDSKALASVDATGVLKLWDVATRAPLKSVMLTGGGLDIAVAPHGPTGTLWTAVALGAGNTVTLLDLAAATPTAIGITIGGPNDTARTIAFSPDGMALAIGTSAGAISIWDVTNKQAITKVGAPVYTSATRLPWDIAFTPDGRYLAMAWAGFGDGGAVLTSTTQPPRQLGGSVTPEWIPISVAFSPDGHGLVAGEYRCGQLIYCRD
jgi:WD40 repeat protein